MSIFQVPPPKLTLCAWFDEPMKKSSGIPCLACHYALCLEMDLISKMKYKFFCVFFQLFFSCKKDTITRGTHAKIFNFVLTPVPDSHFSRLFSSPPPPLIRKRGEKVSERTLDQSCDDILVNTFGDCPTTIWQTVIGWWWRYWCHCTASQCHDDGDGDDDGDDDAQCVNGWSKWIVLENKTLHFKMV